MNSNLNSANNCNLNKLVNITFMNLYLCTYSKHFTCDILPMSCIPNLNILGIHPTTICIMRLFLSRYCWEIMATLWHKFCSWWCSRTIGFLWYSAISSNISYSLSTDNTSITLWFWLFIMNFHHVPPHFSSVLSGSIAAFSPEHLYSPSRKCT